MKKLRQSALAAMAFVALAAPPVAFAHAFPVRSQPRVGATGATAPETVRIWFNGDLEPLFDRLVVKDPAGKVVSRGNARVDAKDPTLLEVALDPLPPGSYHVYWHVTARDGHSTEGDYTFTVSGH